MVGKGSVLALIAPGKIREVTNVLYSIEEGMSKNWNITVAPWSDDGNNWIAVLGTPKETNDGQ
jgi:hypothetical protein